jgi:ribosome-associated protein
MIHITDDIALDEREILIDYIRAAGPGGQNVNKVATAVQLRFDLARSPSLPDAVKARARQLAGARLTADGWIVITARQFRSQSQNREAAIGRLAALLQRAARPPKTRRPTQVGAAERARRLEEKKRRSAQKRTRRPVDTDNE